MAMAQMGFIILSVSILLSLRSSVAGPLNIKLWCSQTPYPDPCYYFMSQNPNSYTIMRKTEFKTMAMQIALDQAIQAQTHIMWPRMKWQSKREEAAWADCLKLYENAIHRLNFTITHYVQYSVVDAQTWLSTALTNVETCPTSFIELGFSNHMMLLFMSNNVSKLICNALAINKVEPSWVVSIGARKLLRVSNANLVVAQDGSGKFEKIQEAVDAALKREGSERFVIHVKAGTYNENVEIGNKGKNIMLIGDGIGKTIVTGSKSVGGGSTTFNSATFAANGDGFIARDITFRNTAGPSNGQAVALRSGSDLSTFYRCSFEGYQDTLYVYSDRQFYRECNIYGTIDFIFGNAAVVFQNCNIYIRTTSLQKIYTITAQSRSDPNQNTGIVIQNSTVMAISDSNLVQNSTRTYLGRPWRGYSRSVFLKNYLDSSIHPAGWLEWSNKSHLNTLYYGEYENTGPGSSTAQRVKWGGYHVITSTLEALKFTVGNFLSADSWLLSTNVPFNPGL